MAVERFPVEAGHILQFARAIGDSNPVYSGAQTGEAEVIAPPTFVQASAHFDPDHPLRPHPGRPWFGSGSNPSGLTGVPDEQRRGRGAGGPGGVLHAEQHYEYHRPLHAGEVLTATTTAGGTWERQGRRAGRLVFSEQITEYRTLDGELVVTARSVGVRTERPVEG